MAACLKFENNKKRNSLLGTHVYKDGMDPETQTSARTIAGMEAKKKNPNKCYKLFANRWSFTQSYNMAIIRRWWEDIDEKGA